MSRKKLLPPRDPLALKLYCKRAGRTLPQLRRALADLGYQDVVSVNSVGSLKSGLPPGTLVTVESGALYR